MPTMHLPYDRVPAQLPNQKAWSPLEKRQPVRLSAHERGRHGINLKKKQRKGQRKKAPRNRMTRDLTGSRRRRKRFPRPMSRGSYRLPVGQLRSFSRLSQVPAFKGMRRTMCLRSALLRTQQRSLRYQRLKRTRKEMPDHRLPACLHLRWHRSRRWRSRHGARRRRLHKRSKRSRCSIRLRQSCSGRRWDRHRCQFRPSPAGVAKCGTCGRRCKSRTSSLSPNSLKRL
mmetsp:Transcript_45643/g.99429  ORF Transcript_45643/g.99429 Transcript_45643/m.99429 type:complete len:228 (-) Transcript_45643:130-813(-)